MRIVAKALTAGPAGAPPSPASRSGRSRRPPRRPASCASARCGATGWCGPSGCCASCCASTGAGSSPRVELADVDDVFYLLVDELDAPPPDLAAVVARRRAEQRALRDAGATRGVQRAVAADAAPPRGARRRGDAAGPRRVAEAAPAAGFASYRPGTSTTFSRARCWSRRSPTSGTRPAFAYAAAVVTELGGPISHAAIVAREFGVPCVVNARGAATRLPTGALIEVDGATGEVTVLGD